MVFQDFQLFPHLTALGNVAEAPQLVLGLNREQAIERGRRLLKRVGLAEHEDAWPQQLSGGQKQRVPSPARWRWSRAACCATRSRRRSTRN